MFYRIAVTTIDTCYCGKCPFRTASLWSNDI